MLEEYDREEAAQPNASSVTGTSRSGRIPGSVLPAMISAPLEAQVRSPQARFAANALFARQGPGLGLGMNGFPSSAASPAQRDSDEELDSRPRTPVDDTIVGDSTAKEPKHDGPAPFRKHLAEEDQAPSELRETAEFADATIGPSVEPAVLDVGQEAAALNTSSEVQVVPLNQVDNNCNRAPSSSGFGVPEDSTPRATPADVQQRVMSDTTLRQAFRRSRLRSRAGGLNLLAADGTEAGILGDPSSLPSSQRESMLGAFSGTGGSMGAGPNVTPGDELSAPSLAHLTRMLHQTLARADVPHRNAWVEFLVPLILRVVQRVRPNPRGGEGMDVRHYVKIKRVPGGRPSDCQYVDGESNS